MKAADFSERFLQSGAWKRNLVSVSTAKLISLVTQERKVNIWFEKSLCFCLRLLIPRHPSSGPWGYGDHVTRLAAAKTGEGLLFLAPHCTFLTKSMVLWRMRTQSQVDCLQRSPWGTKTSAGAGILCSKSQKCVHMCFLVYASGFWGLCWNVGLFQLTLVRF